MKHLIIIGNGFDLAHGLKTDYKSFIADIEEDINTDQKKYGLKKLSDNSFLYLLSKEKFIDPNWSDIENFYFKLLMKIGEAEKDKINYGLNVEMLNDNFQQVKEFLAKYLHKQELKLIKKKNGEEVFEANENYQEFFSFFNNQFSEKGNDCMMLNFNYTQTAGRYIDKAKNSKGLYFGIVPIHGELNDKKELNPMIFGYAADDKESKRLLDENNSQFVRNIKKFNYMFTRNEPSVKKFLENDGKPCDVNVYILGHSCGLSDKLILNQIFNSENVKNIYPFYYAGEKGDKAMDGYFEMMVNIDRIIDDYSKEENKGKAFQKLALFKDCKAMPQGDKDQSLRDYLREKVGYSAKDLKDTSQHLKPLEPKVNK